MLLEIIFPGKNSSHQPDIQQPAHSIPYLIFIMHLIRRAAFRAAGASNAQLSSAPRSFSTISPFVARSKIQSAIPSAVFRRYNSDDSKPIESADAEEDSTVRSAIEASEWKSSGSTGGRFNNTVDRGVRSRPIKPNPGIYIGNLLFEATTEDLAKIFEEFGTIKSIKIATDARGLSKGFAYIEFETTEQATAAIEAKNQSTFEGRQLLVNYMASTFNTRPPVPPSKTLFLGNLAYELSDADLNKLFRDVRHVLDVRVAIDRRTGQPRGFAHADFVDIESATEGKKILDGKELYGRKMRVDFSAGQQNRPPRPARQNIEATEDSSEGNTNF